ncbi:MAG: hypothetical protein BWY82_02094 [Verrucomicrobia bacterium ADurb.Bin474]|nr:MAG: hypothetical protein BWY82_02094 [Verrucomicrobia bacterium ADurb.Bin474]
MNAGGICIVDRARNNRHFNLQEVLRAFQLEAQESAVSERGEKLIEWIGLNRPRGREAFVVFFRYLVQNRPVEIARILGVVSQVEVGGNASAGFVDTENDVSRTDSGLCCRGFGMHMGDKCACFPLVGFVHEPMQFCQLVVQRLEFNTDPTRKDRVSGFSGNVVAHDLSVRINDYGFEVCAWSQRVAGVTAVVEKRYGPIGQWNRR